MILEEELLSGYPTVRAIEPAVIAAAVKASGRILVVLDDDPTGTQSVANLPVLTSWEPSDFAWAFDQRIDGAPAPAVYVLTNTRSLDPETTASRNREIVTNSLTAAAAAGVTIGFVSRSDSTLRGHFPLETDVIGATLLALAGTGTDGVVMVPAFPDAGRITIGGVHYLRGDDGAVVPVADTEFARDATFGFVSSDLGDYVAEKTGGSAHAVIRLDLSIIRSGAEGIADALARAADAVPIVVDAVTEDDLRALALGLEESERRGKKLLYRVGPPFVRARIGQRERPPLTAADVFAGHDAPASGGLVVVGSHVGLTTRQLDALVARRPEARLVELDVEAVLDPAERDTAVVEAVRAVVEGLSTSEVVLHTSRRLVRSDDPEQSLEFARTISRAVVDVVRSTIATAPVRFVIAKGGITSSDVAAHGLSIRRALVRGPMLPGIVSLWQPADGPARSIPFVVFAGNVGTDDSLADVVEILRSPATSSASTTGASHDV
ncbi:four-carbon acid sugar kinase family protein [Arthrobacter sp. SX1312]|uniref:four-carbon acid sugar kinase family protein n=1 Tax=Arthrobacter sp. SX1312 TaxID=2058896 RepID=UPI000CE3F61F|nr:four-carbon acid sugar kinase family protein [Arthrobacter sp. SX1312]